MFGSRIPFHSILRSGAVSALLCVAVAGCRFPYSFTGGGLDPKLRTVAVLPFDNKTAVSGLDRELQELISNDMRRLSLREAPQAVADVVVSGTITRYEADIPIAFSADPTRTAGTRRKLEVTVDVSITQPAEGKVLFKKIFSASGEYAEGSEVTGRREAFVKVVNDMIQGVQSQW
jgi:hypothetical protein